VIEVKMVVSEIGDQALARTPLSFGVDIPRHCHRYLKDLVAYFPEAGLVLVGGSDSHVLILSLILDEAVEGERPSAVVFADPQATTLYLLSVLSHIPVDDLLTWDVPPTSFESFNEAGAAIFKTTLVFSHFLSLDSVLLATEIRDLRVSHGIKILFLDAASRLSAGLCSRLEKIARTEGILIIAGTQDSDLEALSKLADVGVLIQDTEEGSLLEVMDSGTGRSESVFCYYEEITTSGTPGALDLGH
jgi:hypothetical protein